MIRGNRLIVLFAIISLVVISIPIIAYLVKFSASNLSLNNQDWAHFGVYMNGVLAPIIALTGALVSLVLNEISNARNRALLTREEMAQRPLMHVYSGDYDNCLRIAMKNKGLGALTITKYELININTQEKYSSFFELVSKYDQVLQNYTGDMKHQILAAGEEKELFKAENTWINSKKKIPKRNQEEFMNLATALRKILKNYKIVVGYTDIYKRQMDNHEFDFTWYGRMENVEVIPESTIFTDSKK